MRTTARILASLGTGILVMGLAAFRSPQTAPAVQAAGLSQAQAETMASPWIPSSMGRQSVGSEDTIPGQPTWAPWNRSSSVAGYADDDDHHDRDRNRDRNRDWRRDQRQRRNNSGWNWGNWGRNRNRGRDRDDRDNWRRHDNGRHRGWWKGNRRDRDDRYRRDRDDRRRHDDDDD